MSEEDSPTAAAVSADESGAKASPIDEPSNDEEGAPSGNGLSNSMQPRLRVHGEDSVAYITVSDPVHQTEGIKGKFTMYRVAYDPPLPAADVDAKDASTGRTDKALFPYATSVNRRYSDFSWLFDHLHRERPGAIVPPLPEKQQTSRFAESFIEERMFHLELFLRRVVCNPELKDTECLLAFLGGGDAEFKKAKKVGSAKSNVDANLGQTLSDDYNMNDELEMNVAEQNQDHSGIVGKGKVKLSTGKKGIKKWLKEKKTTMQGQMVRSPDDAVFEEVTHFISALEAGLRRVEAQASAMIKRDKDVSSCILEFGLGCDALAHIDDEINGAGVGNETGSSGVGQTFRLIGMTADATSAISAEHYEREVSAFYEPLQDHLKMIHAVKVAIQKRSNRRITYSTCLNAVDTKKASLHKYRVTPGQEGKAIGVESSLSRAETSVIAARTNYEEVSARVLREVDRFRKENAAAMYATMVEFARAQKEHHEKMNEAWGAVLPRVEELDASKYNGSSFARMAAGLREGRPGSSGSGGGAAVEGVAAQVENMSMPSYPPPPEPAGGQSNNGTSGTTASAESSMLNGAVRYRDPLPEE